MKEKDFERIRKRELRIAYRAKRLKHEKDERERLREKKEREALFNKEAPYILMADNKKVINKDKKPDLGEFLAQYSFIPATASDSRRCIPPSWRPKSFNKKRQHFEFLKKFVYPYPLPETLLWAALENEYLATKNGGRCKSEYYGVIQLAKQWIRDIASGESFYKQNKRFFTKAEAHWFLSSKMPYAGCASVIKLFFYAKCRARSLSHKVSLLVSEVFSVKFDKWYMNRLVEGFLDLIARAPCYSYENAMLGDLCDFVLAKRKEAFSFSGRTISSVIRLVNEWHDSLRREAEAERIQRAEIGRGQANARKNEKPVDTSKWKGLGIAQFRYETDGCLWMVTELKTAKDLLNEGRKMHNCVSFYSRACASGDCSIFTVECAFSEGKDTEKIATLEVRLANRALVQAKGKCNTAITPRTRNVITRWAAANGISVKLQV
jgi:hypothetical protein